MTSPASLMGTVIQDNATILAGIVLTQLINPGIPVIYGNVSCASDMKNVSLALGAPEGQLIQMASLALGRYYQLPVRAGVAGNDSLKPDYQAGVETTTHFMTTYLGKSDLILNGLGILHSFAVGSYEKFVLDEEIARIMMRLNKGINISESKTEQILSEIKKAGPLGNYLKGRTPKEYRQEHHLTNIFNRKAGEAKLVYEESGDIRERACKIVNERIENYQLPDLTQTQKNILNRYLPENEKF